MKKPSVITGAGMLVFVLLTGCSTEQRAQPASLVNTTVENPDEVTCRSVVKTGTRIGTRVCKTNRAWAMGSSQGRNMAEDIQRKSSQGLADPNYGG